MPCCSLAEVHQNDVVKLRLELVDPDGNVIDISTVAGVTDMSITCTLPSGTSFTTAAGYVIPPDGVGDGTDGLMEIETTEGQLSEVGPGHQYQGRVEFGSGSPVHSSIVTFEVFPNL